MTRSLWRPTCSLAATEQLFNLMAGRKLQEALGQRPQICLTLPILVGTDGQLAHVQEHRQLYRHRRAAR